jgi:hypothetical protein
MLAFRSRRRFRLFAPCQKTLSFRKQPCEDIIMNCQGFTLKKTSVTRAALLAMTAGLSLGASVAHAAPVDSGPVSIAIPATTAGIYLNVVTGASGTATATPGWDFNPWGATTRQFFWTTTATTNGGGDATGTVYRALNPGDVVGPASTFINGSAAVNSVNHQAAGNRIIGFRFLNETGGTVHYGYAVLNSAAATGVPGTITRYVFESTPNTAITVPGGGPPPVTPSVPVNATSTWSLIALMLALFGFAAVAVRRQA